MKVTTHDITHPGRQLNIATPQVKVMPIVNQNKPTGKHVITHPTLAKPVAGMQSMPIVKGKC